MKRLAAMFVAAATLLGVTGCDQFLPEPLAFTLVDGVIVARTCVPLTISNQSISFYPDDEHDVSLGVWYASGSVHLPAGSEFAIDRPLNGFTETTAMGTDLLARKFYYTMDVDAGRGGQWTTRSHINPGDLAEGEWLDSRGAPLDTPCTHERCSPMAACFNDWPEPTGQPTESRATFTPALEPTPSATP
jgi:hypothetical protein